MRASRTSHCVPARVAPPRNHSWKTTSHSSNQEEGLVPRGAGPGGQIVVRLAHKTAQRMISIDVEDDGDGMPPNVRRWLVEEDPETGQVVGIALRLVHDVVAAHGGGVVIKSSTDLGDRGTSCASGPRGHRRRDAPVTAVCPSNRAMHRGRSFAPGELGPTLLGALAINLPFLPVWCPRARQRARDRGAQGGRSSVRRSAGGAAG